MVVLEVTDVKKECRRLQFNLAIRGQQSQTKLYYRKHCIEFNRRLDVRNDAVFKFFDAVKSLNSSSVSEVKVDLERQAVENQHSKIVVLDGGGLDSNSIMLLSRQCDNAVSLAFDIKEVHHNRSLISPKTIFISTDLPYSIPFNDGKRQMQIKLSSTTNMRVLALLVYDALDAKMILQGNVDNANDEPEEWLGMPFYSCSFINGNFNSSLLNAALDEKMYFMRLKDSGYFPPFKSLVKFMYTKAIERKYGFKLMHESDCRYLKRENVSLVFKSLTAKYNNVHASDYMFGTFSGCHSRENVLEQADVVYSIEILGRDFFYQLFKHPEDRKELDRLFEMADSWKRNKGFQHQWLDLEKLKSRVKDDRFCKAVELNSSLAWEALKKRS